VVLIAKNSKQRVNLTLYDENLSYLDKLVEKRKYRSRSDALDHAVDLLREKHIEVTDNANR